MAGLLPASFPLKIYENTLLADISSRELLPTATPTDDESIHPFPSNYSYEPSFSLLPGDKMNFDLAEIGGEKRPPDLKQLFSDTPDPKPVYLVTYLNSDIPRHRHMAVRWVVDVLPRFSGSGFEKAARTLELCDSKHEVELYGHYLLNPGPRTAPSLLVSTGETVAFLLGTFTVKQRLILEQISWNVGVAKPDGEFNCQNWATAVLAVAVARGVMDEGTVKKALEMALHPYPKAEFGSDCLSTILGLD